MGEIIRPDLLITQILGFLIVLWVLKRFAWGPVLAMLESRRRKIASDVDAAKHLRTEAETLRAQYEEQIRAIEAESRQRIQEAVQEGQKIAEEIKATAQADAQRISEKAKADLELEVNKAKATLRSDMVRLSLDAAGRLIGGSLDDEHHRKLVDGFLDDLQKQESS